MCELEVHEWLQGQSSFLLPSIVVPAAQFRISKRPVSHIVNSVSCLLYSPPRLTPFG